MEVMYKDKMTKLKSNSTYTDIILDNRDIRNLELNYCNLANATLRRAYVANVNFHGSSLWKANFHYASLLNVDFSNCDLTDADFTGVSLRNVNFADANLNNVKGLNRSRITILPDEGDIIGWKKASNKNGTKFILVKLLIPNDAKRTGGIERKCRASKAVVLDAWVVDIFRNTQKQFNTKNFIYSIYDYTFRYKIGQTLDVSKDWKDEDWWRVCTNGIHFFITKQEALDY